jgi:hypothetical protein
MRLPSSRELGAPERGRHDETGNRCGHEAGDVRGDPTSEVIGGGLLNALGRSKWAITPSHARAITGAVSLGSGDCKGVADRQAAKLSPAGDRQHSGAFRRGLISLWFSSYGHRGRSQATAANPPLFVHALKNKLTAAMVRQSKPGMHADGDGLFLQVTKGRDGKPSDHG